MTDGVLITYDRLKEVDEQMLRIIQELQDASKRADVLEHAIGDPYGRDELREAAEEFEDGWDDRRRGLAADLQEVEQHVAGVLEGFGSWDDDTTTQLSGSGD